MSFNAETGRFAVRATGVPRGELLDQLAKVAQIEVRPQPPRDEPLTISADGLDLDELLARIMPADARYIARRGQLELASKVPGVSARKEGAETTVAPGLNAKGKGGAATRTGSGTLKAAADSKLAEAPSHPPAPASRLPPQPWWPAKRTNPRSRSLSVFRGRSCG